MWRYGINFWKTEALYAELNGKVEAATSSYASTGKFLQYIYFMLVTENYQKIWSRCFVHKFPFIDIFKQYYSKLQLYWRKILCGYFCFLSLWLLIAIMKRYAERCALQLYRTSLITFKAYSLQHNKRSLHHTFLNKLWAILQNSFSLE